LGGSPCVGSTISTGTSNSGLSPVATSSTVTPSASQLARDLALGGVLVDELGEGEPSPHAASAANLLQRPLQRRPRVRSLLKPPRCTRFEFRPPAR
jgi:hypothetical protein